MDALAPEEFRALGHAVVDRLADHLDACARRAVPVLPWVPPDDMLARWPEPTGLADPLALLDRVIAESNHLHHPRYVGHQVTAPLPLAALAELVSAFLNNSMAVYEMGPVSTAMERRVIEWMGARVGMRAGVLTSGGSLGNLTALLAARSVRPVAAPAILASSQAHYCVRRAAHVMGLGEHGVVEVPVDARYRMDVSAIPAALARARSLGREPIALVASACSTATGAFDPLAEVAELCQREGLWLHVDGAHGASAALSARYRPLLDGIERADSVVWDAHKMMLVPSLSTAVLFREPRASYDPFAREASYLFEDRAEPPWWDIGLRTLECTKRMMALPIYLSLAVNGEAFFDTYVTRCFDLARRFAAMLREAGFELPTEPMANIVCFRHPSMRDDVRRSIVERGAFHLVQTRLSGETYLRTTLINPRTTEQDLAALIDAVRSEAA